MSKNWYKPTFWRWWWQAQAPAEAKVLAATLACGLLVFGGWEALGLFSSASAAEVYTYVQTVRRVRVQVVTNKQPMTVRVHGRVVTVDPPPRTVTGRSQWELVTVTTSGHGAARTETVPVTEYATRSGQTVVMRPPAVTRVETAQETRTVPVVRVQTTTVGRASTVTVERTSAQQTVLSERTVTQAQPVTATVTRTSTVAQPTTAAKEVTTTVVQPTTQTVSVTEATTVPVTTTVTRTATETHTVTQTVVTTLPVTVTVTVTVPRSTT
jgi:hypothetical protein